MQNTQESGSNGLKKLVHIDQKVLVPADVTKTVVETEELASASKAQKSIIGKPKVYDLKGNLLAEEENLVVLGGREFLAQKLMGGAYGATTDLSNYEVRYFGIGAGGTDGGATPTTVGPYDLDDILVSPVQFDATGGNIDSATNSYKYISTSLLTGGYLKNITSDGSIDIIQEEHTVNTATDTLTVSRYTSIKFTLKIDITEPATKPFRFNEAGLYAVEIVGGVPTGNAILFARFTTLDKYLDTNDGILIEWHVLV